VGLKKVPFGLKKKQLFLMENDFNLFHFSKLSSSFLSFQTTHPPGSVSYLECSGQLFSSSSFIFKSLSDPKSDPGYNL